MLIKIDDERLETFPHESQYIVFKCGHAFFAGIYKGDRKACPFTIDGSEPPVIFIEEWLPIRLWN